MRRNKIAKPSNIKTGIYAGCIRPDRCFAIRIIKTSVKIGISIKIDIKTRCAKLAGKGYRAKIDLVKSDV